MEIVYGDEGFVDGCHDYYHGMADRERQIPGAVGDIWAQVLRYVMTLASCAQCGYRINSSQCLPEMVHPQ